jgi:hypothetical protein
VTNDLIAAVAYPTVAAGHLIIQILNFPESGYLYMSANLINFIIQAHNGPVKFGKKNSGYPYPADLTSPKRTEVYPRVASIIASLRVVNCFIFLAVITLAFTFPDFWEKRHTKAQLRHRRSLLLMVGGSLILSSAAEFAMLVIIEGCDFEALSTSDGLFCFYMPLFLVFWPTYCLIILYFSAGIVTVATDNILPIYRHPSPLQKIRQH